MTRAAAVMLAAASFAVATGPAAARAHEVLHLVVRGDAVSVRATYGDGEPLAYAEAEVFSPRDPRVPHQRGRTDRNGWVSFVPDAPGAWRVRIIGRDGHGLDTKVDVDRSHVGQDEHGRGIAVSAPGLRFILRPIAGVLAIVAVFVALFLWKRSERGGRG